MAGPTRRGRVGDGRCTLRPRLLHDVVFLRTAGMTSPGAGTPLLHPCHFASALSAVRPELSTAMSPWQPRNLGTGGHWAANHHQQRDAGRTSLAPVAFWCWVSPGWRANGGICRRGLHKPCPGFAPWPDPALASPSTVCWAQEVAADSAWLPSTEPQSVFFTLINKIQAVCPV